MEENGRGGRSQKTTWCGDRKKDGKIERYGGDVCSLSSASVSLLDRRAHTNVSRRHFK